MRMTPKRALIVGVANERSLAWAIAEKLHRDGFELAFTYQGDNLERRVKPLAQSLNPDFLCIPCDVRNDGQIAEVYAELGKRWDSMSGLVHSVAFAQKEELEGNFVNTSRAGFSAALDVSAYTLVALARPAVALFEKAGGGTILTLSYYGSQKVVPNYNVMGVAKAALEASVRYLAFDLGPKKVRVNAISAGPVKTLAAMGIRDFKSMLAESESSTPLKENISAEDVGELGAFLCGPGGKHITGSTIYVDSGAHIMA